MQGERVASLAFARAARGYWLYVFPRVARELRGLRARAQSIPDAELRSSALAALAKRGNMEGAAAFATFAPRAHRDAVIRATVAFQAAYNHLDVLCERPSGRSFEDARELHGALLAALSPYAPLSSDRARGAKPLDPGEDAGYLAHLIASCRAALAALPAWPVAAPAAERAVVRVIDFQAHQARRPEGAAGDEAPLGDALAGGSDEAIARWGAAVAPDGCDLRWWETAAAAGSSLGLHAMIAAAADPALTPGDVAALEHAYFPWIGALHSMLDHLVDVCEDARDRQRNLIGCYASREEAAERMAMLAHRSLTEARALRPQRRHVLVVTAMACSYLTDPCARMPDAAPIASAVLEALGPLARPAMTVFRMRAGVERLFGARCSQIYGYALIGRDRMFGNRWPSSTAGTSCKRLMTGGNPGAASFWSCSAAGESARAD